MIGDNSIYKTSENPGMKAECHEIMMSLYFFSEVCPGYPWAIKGITFEYDETNLLWKSEWSRLDTEDINWFALHFFA